MVSDQERISFGSRAKLTETKVTQKTLAPGNPSPRAPPVDHRTPPPPSQPANPILAGSHGGSARQPPVSFVMRPLRSYAQGMVGDRVPPRAPL
ncbi:unnamed protein product [Sphenostylis stenocarpa]|uniref:Uncharacterized protein n=1 Tax=Sphenostylis stenocarpa TaxID=92480 RepID=A0AA86VKI6_9FABA|nr:unnamed protein product [Sphenostylis stenocarpa]